jgi:hypothetical protein
VDLSEPDGRPPASAEIATLIEQFAAENPRYVELGIM